MDSIEDRIIDLNFVIARLRVSDCADFAASMKSPAYRARALSGCLLKGIALRRDAQEFLRHRKDRVKRAKDSRVNGLGYINDYSGKAGDLRGLSADFVNRTIHFPPDYGFVVGWGTDSRQLVCCGLVMETVGMLKSQAQISVRFGRRTSGSSQ